MEKIDIIPYLVISGKSSNIKIGILADDVPNSNYKAGEIVLFHRYENDPPMCSLERVLYNLTNEREPFKTGRRKSYVPFSYIKYELIFSDFTKLKYP